MVEKATKVVAQVVQLGDALFDLRKPLGQHASHPCAGHLARVTQRQDLADVCQRQPRALGVADEADARRTLGS